MTVVAHSWTYCGQPEPTDECESFGHCDYHAGEIPACVDLDACASFDNDGRFRYGVCQPFREHCDPPEPHVA